MLISDYVLARAQRYKSKHYGAVAERFSKVTVPTEIEILKLQKEIALSYKINQPFILQKLVQTLNYGSNMDQAILSNTNYIQAFIQKIEKNIGDLKNTDIVTQAAQQNISFEAAYNNLVQEWYNIINTIGSYQSSHQVEYALKAFETKINALETQIRTQGQVNLPYYQWQTFTGQIVWIGNVIKGFYLEAEGAKLASKIPGIQGIQTGNLRFTYELGGRSYTSPIKEDIMIFGNANNSALQIKFTLGNDKKIYTTGLDEFLEKVQSGTETRTIVLRPESYELLQRKSIAGVSAKATKNPYFVFARDMSIPKLLSYAKAESQTDLRTWALQHLYSLYHSMRNQVYKMHQDYDLLYNYIVSKIYPRFIGKHNNLVLTREGFKTTYDFLLDNFNRGRYVRASKQVGLSGSYNIQIEREL